MYIQFLKLFFFCEDLCVDMKDFKFGAVVGRGSFATVHRGTWSGIEVALKRIRMPCRSGATTTNLPKDFVWEETTRGIS